jgi:hypothetical protein
VQSASSAHRLALRAEVIWETETLAGRSMATDHVWKRERVTSVLAVAAAVWARRVERSASGCTVEKDDAASVTTDDVTNDAGGKGGGRGGVGGGVMAVPRGGGAWWWLRRPPETAAYTPTTIPMHANAVTRPQTTQLKPPDDRGLSSLGDEGAWSCATFELSSYVFLIIADQARGNSRFDT